MRGRDLLAVALDVPHLGDAEPLLRALAGVPGWIKIGAELFTAAGPAALASASAAGSRVFLDTKIHDIPHTAARAVAAATRHGVGMLTLHASGGLSMLAAAREAADDAAASAGREPPALLGVTVLTSFGPADLKEIGVDGSMDGHVARLVDLAVEAGLDGVVASPREAASVRARAGAGFRIVTPGIRPASWPADDQTRTATATEAVAAGADVLVVGRPVVRAQDPAAAAREVVREIEDALLARNS